MSALARLQGDFQDYMLRGAPAIEAQVVGTTRVPVATRLAVYGRAYVSRLGEALGSNFPALARLLGEADFEALTADYVREHDSPFFSIRYYGDQLAQFLATHERYAPVPLLAELARWEWTMTGVFDAADATALTHASLARIPPNEWAQLRFTFHPSVACLSLEWNVPQIWRALIDDSERPAVTLNPAPVPWLVWRQELATYFRSVPQSEAAVLDAARRGWPFGELCALLCTQLGDQAAPEQAATLLRDWIASGLIVGAA